MADTAHVHSTRSGEGAAGGIVQFRASQNVGIVQIPASDQHEASGEQSSGVTIPCFKHRSGRPEVSEGWIVDLCSSDGLLSIVVVSVTAGKDASGSDENCTILE